MTFPNARTLLYRYLLGEAAEEENLEVEERLLYDAFYRERLQETDHELIAAYVSGDLTLDKGERFEKNFLRSEERREKLRLAELLYEYARIEVNKLPTASEDLCRYLLGELTLDEELQVMERLIIDDDYKKQLEIAEHELIAAYTLEKLTETQRGRFERYFFDSEEKQEKLRFAETVYAYYQYVEWAETANGAEASRFDRLRRWLSEPIGNRREFRTSSPLIESPHRH
jgi:hypothetical protein